MLAAMRKYKVYYTDWVTGKNGVTKPVTKVRYSKACPQCGSEMEIEKYAKGGVHKAPFIRWNCSDEICKHSETEPTNHESLRIKSNI